MYRSHQAGPSKLDATTVHDDGVGNKVDVGPGLDWLFVNLDGIGNNGVKDKVGGNTSGDYFTPITL